MIEFVMVLGWYAFLALVAIGLATGGGFVLMRAGARWSRRRRARSGPLPSRVYRQIREPARPFDAERERG